MAAFSLCTLSGFLFSLRWSVTSPSGRNVSWGHILLNNAENGGGGGESEYMNELQVGNKQSDV